MDKIQFDIKYRPEIEAGKYRVVTKAGYPVRILCWDANCKYPIVGLVGGATTEEYSYQWKENGRSSIGITFNYDLVLVPVEQEPELTEFEKAVDAIYESCDVKELALKKKAKELLGIAKKQLIPEFAVTHYKEVMKAREEGKAEVMKDLPRWKKCSWNFEHGDIGITREGEDILSYKGYEILLSELFDNLPKEE